jgi:hypothetical protein
VKKFRYSGKAMHYVSLAADDNPPDCRPTGAILGVKQASLLRKSYALCLARGG